MQRSLETKLVQGGFSLALLLLSGVGAISYLNVRKVTYNQSEIEHTYQVLDAIDQIEEGVKDAERGRRGYVIANNPIFLEVYYTGVRKTRTGIFGLHQLTTGNSSQQQNIEQLKPLIDRKFSSMQRSIQQLQTNPADQAIQIQLTNEGQRLQQQIQNQLAIIEDEQQIFLNQRLQASHSNMRYSLILVSSGYTLSFSLLIITFTLLQRHISERHEAEVALQKANEVLEERVLQRTITLSKLNQTLELEVRERQQAEIALQTANNNLEIKVLERVAELRQLNNRLQVELFERERTQRILQHQARLLDLSHDTILTRNLNAMITFWNHGAEAMYGWKKAEALGKESHTLFNTQFLVSLAEIEAELLKNNYWEGELIHTRRDGSQIFVSSRWVLERDHGGNPLEILEINTDITARKQVETALQFSQARFAGILDIAKDAIISVNQDHKITLFNQGAEQIFGYAASEVVGQPLNILLPLRFAEAHHQHVHQFDGSAASARKMGDRAEVFGRRKDGTEFPAEASISKFNLANEQIFTVILQDITERKQSEHALRESEERFRNAFDNAPIGLALVDTNGRWLKVNNALCEILGYSSAELLSINFQTITHPDDLELDLQVMQQVLQGELRTHTLQKRYLHKQGRIIWGLLNISLVHDEHNQPLYFISQIQDITEQREIERMKNEFISVVSHELRTPLTAIRGSINLLASGVLDKHPAKAQRMLEIAAIDTERLVRLVNDILDLERLGTSNLPLQREYCNAADLMQQSIEGMQLIADKAEIQLYVEPLSVFVWAAPDRIIQTLTNLLNNAIKFSAPDSSITLTATLQGDEVMFAVKDQGRGIPADKLESIFGRFQQVDASDSRQKGGTGLGLAICRSIIEQHGGRIWVESAIGQGSVFYFTLPTQNHS
jgi:PAS domain S-box-containing protein